MRTPTYCLAAFLFTLLPPAILADTLTFSSGRSISGTVLQTNGDNLLLLTDYATFRFSRSGLKAIEIAQTPSFKRRARRRTRSAAPRIVNNPPDGSGTASTM
jgi:hypothetical protein